MPHITLEHTENIELNLVRDFFKQLRIILMDIADIKEENCKCRAILIPVYEVGKGDDLQNFYHLEISILKGRSQKTRQKIGQESLQILKEYFMGKDGKNLKQFSVEIREMDHSDYFSSTNH